MSDNAHTTRVYTLTVRHGVRLSLAIPMRSILLAISALVMIAASSADAAPKKKAPPAAAVKRPSAPVNNSPAPDTAPAANGDASGSSVRGPTRIDFDDRLIQGQTNRSGAVYLYDRKELKIRSMIKKRENFRDEIIGSLYDS